MNPDNNTERKKKLTKFGILVFVTAGLIALLLSSLWRNNNAGAVAATTNGDPKLALLMDEYKRLQQFDELLHEKLAALQQSDKEYAASLTGSGKSNKSPDELNRSLRRQDQDFSVWVDSLRLQVFKFTNGDTKNNFSKMIASFRLAADSREAMGGLRNAVAIGRNGFSANEKAMLSMQNELDNKTKRIIALENSLKSSATNNETIKNTAGDDNRKLLNEHISTLENQVSSLSAAYNNLKEENERLLKVQNENTKSNSSNEAVIKEKNAGLQQKVDALSAELQLARVDCNLNRVDATQIISTAKQRKQLLTEASSILSDLSVSNSTDIKKKVKEKILRLNQVAANSRD